MALQDANGVYLKVTEVHPWRGYVTVNYYKDSDTRANPTRFDNVELDKFRVKNILDIVASVETTGNVIDDMIKGGYEALKTVAPFNDGTWTDV